MSQTDISTKEKYYEYVNYIVDVMEEEYDLENEDLTELVFREVDSAHIILYSNYHMDILHNSMKGAERWNRRRDAEWRDVIQSMAFDILRQDIWQELRNRDY